MRESMTYAGVGVDYDVMDPFKRAAQRAARETADMLKRFGFSEVEMSRGESVYLIETPDSYLAHVEEGLGTKNLVADVLYSLSFTDTAISHYGKIAQDAVAMIVNDLITLGALPLSVAMHLAVGNSGWFHDKQRCQELIDGWKNACLRARCAWGGGETPTLKGIIVPGKIALSGSALGIIKPKDRLITSKIQHGDAIVLIGNSGIHANGLTLAREIAEKLPNGYLTRLSDGRSYGEALLDPTLIYVPLVEDCLDAGIDIHYAVNITGHGWRKLMRARQPSTYVVERIPDPHPLFSFMQEHGPLDDQEAYAAFNMQAGFALYVPEHDVERVIAIAQHCTMRALYAGHVEKGEKKVVIKPKQLEYRAESLGVR